MKNKGVNGCGCGSGLLKYFKPPHHEFFKTVCNIHDTAYDVGGNEEDRKKADVWLFRNMIKKIITSDFSPLKISYFVFIALTYYISVRMFGKKYFNYKEQ